jgi:hypothetical protein
MGKKFFLFRWLNGLFDAIGKVFHKLDDAVKVNIEQVYDILNRVKGTIDESVIDELIVYLIPGEKDDKIVADLRAWLPGVLIALAEIKDTPDVEGQNAKLLAAIKAINISPDNKRGMYLRELAALIVQRVSDGHLDINDAAIIAAFVYKNRKKQEAA